MRCPACGRRLHTVHVHSHGQCAFCGTAIEPCCDGAGDEADAQPWGPHLGIDRRTLLEVFEGLGGAGATVTAEALLHALTARSGGTWEEAARTLETLVREGVVRSDRGRAYRLMRGGGSGSSNRG